MLISCLFYENTDLPTHPGQFRKKNMFPSSSWDMAISDQPDRRVIALSPKCVLKPCTSKIHVKMLNFPWSLGVGSHPLSDMLDQRASNPSRYRMMHTAAGERIHWESQCSMASKWILHYFNLFQRGLVAVKVAALILIETLGFWPLKWHAFFALCT